MKEIGGKHYPDWIIPDTMTPLSVDNADVPPLMLSPKYDYIVHHEESGAFILKVYDDEHGLVSMYIDEATAAYIEHETGVEILTRQTLTVSEYAGHITAMASTQLDDSWLQGDGENPHLP